MQSKAIIVVVSEISSAENKFTLVDALFVDV